MIFFLNQKVDAPVVVALRILAYRVKLEGASLATWTSFQQFPSGGPTLWNNVKYPSCLSGKSSINGGFVQCLSLFSVPKTQKKTTSNQFRPRFWSKKLGQCATFIGAPVRMIHVPFFLDHARGQRGSSSYNSSCPSLNQPPNPGVLFKSCLLSANHIDTSHGGESQHPAEDQLSRKHTPFGEYLHLRVASADSKAMAAKFGDGFIIDLLPWGLWFMSSFLGEFLAMVD